MKFDTQAQPSIEESSAAKIVPKTVLDKNKSELAAYKKAEI
jgi:hypothetical protein